MKALTFDDILLVPQYSDIKSRKDVSLNMTDKKGLIAASLPIMSANMDTITGPEMGHYMFTKGGYGILHRFMTIEENVKAHLQTPSSFVSIGVTQEENKRFLALYKAGCRKFCIDVAHGHSKAVGDLITDIKTAYTDTVIIAGNVCTAEGAQYLEKCGADLIKVGVGPGSVCSTRIKTGHGVPQLSAIKECAHAVKCSIIADGGIKSPGDIVKALAFGADFVMIGSMLAGTHYTPGETFYTENPGPNGIVKKYRGMASKEANDDMFGGLSEWKTAEGVQVVVPYKNAEATDAIIADIIGGIRSGLTYSGARDIRQLQEKAQFEMITTAGMLESHPHKKGV